MHACTWRVFTHLACVHGAAAIGIEEREAQRGALFRCAFHHLRSTRRQQQCAHPMRERRPGQKLASDGGKERWGCDEAHLRKGVHKVSPRHLHRWVSVFAVLHEHFHHSGICGHAREQLQVRLTAPTELDITLTAPSHVRRSSLQYLASQRCSSMSDTCCSAGMALLSFAISSST